MMFCTLYKNCSWLAYLDFPGLLMFDMSLPRPHWITKIPQHMFTLPCSEDMKLKQQV